MAQRIDRVETEEYYTGRTCYTNSTSLDTAESVAARVVENAARRGQPYADFNVAEFVRGWNDSRADWAGFNLGCNEGPDAGD